jgi:4-hydroxybenzoate polyprenyltransferase
MNSWKWYWLLVRPKNLGLTLLLQTVFMLASSRTSGPLETLGDLFRIDWANLRWPVAAFVCLSCLFTAAAGYVINDVYDVETDRINRPRKRIVSQHISPSAAKRFYVVLVAAGLTFGFLSGLGMGLLVTAIALLLFFYSSDLKGTPWQGNLLIALMGGMVVYVASRGVYQVKGGYFAEFALLAFWATLTREITKDAEDVQGDEKGGYKTLAVTKGIKVAKRRAQGAYFMLLVSILLLQLFGIKAQSPLFYNDFSPSPKLLFFAYGWVVVLGLWFWGLLKLTQAQNTDDFHIAANWQKGLMLAGLLWVWLLP